MERNKQNQIVSWSAKEGELRHTHLNIIRIKNHKEGELRDTHLNIIRIKNHIKRLEQEIKQLQKRKEELMDEGTDLYLTELDIKRIEVGCP